MTLTSDISAFTRLSAALSGSVKTISDKAIASAAIKAALKPMLDAARREAPTRSGATRRATRIRTVPGIGGEVVRGLVGVSKKKGQPGRRTHLITRANRNRLSPNDFLARAERQTIKLVIDNYAGSVEDAITKAIARL